MKYAVISGGLTRVCHSGAILLSTQTLRLVRSSLLVIILYTRNRDFDFLNTRAKPGQKVRPPRSFGPESPLRLVQSSFAKRYLMNAIVAQF
jgi:hypothetical protein